MKIKGILLAALSVVGIGGAFAQGVEYDDMYFNAEDRAKLKAMRGTEVAYNTPSKSKKVDFRDEDENINPTDSYSARNVNPEYVSRRHTQSAQAEESEYFVDNYQYNRNQLNNWNNNFNNWYSNSWYRNNYWGPAINSWNSPYYGYNSWNSPWYDPYWAYNGWSSSFSFHYGHAWNYGWGGYYNYWNRPYYGWGWDSFYSPYAGLGWYGGSYWNNWRYPGTIIIIDGEGGRNTVYGKRPSRATVVSDRSAASRSRTNSGYVRQEENSSTGRVSSQSRKQEDYYNRYNNNRATAPTYDSRTNTQYNRVRSDSWNNSSWDSNRSGRTSSPSYSPSNSSPTRTNSGGSTGGRRGRD
jgi:hypothetical protein